MKLLENIKGATRSILRALAAHKKKVIGGAVVALFSAYLYKRLAPYARKIKSTYDMVANFSESMGGSSKISAYESIIKTFQGSAGQQLAYIQNRLDSEFQVPTLKARVTDSALSAHEKISTF